jgi:hypothetical protein
MTNYNYYYNKQIISRDNFLMMVPENWESNLDWHGEYSFGYYRAIPRD